MIFMEKFQKAVKIADLTSKTLKLFNFEGTSLPGKIVQKICPDFLRQCSTKVASPRFAITGTNGKTTTSTLLSEILLCADMKIVNNKLGANMPNGIITALASGLNKTKRAQGAVLECDEAYFSHIANCFPFDYLLITNLFRDQLDRYGEMDIAKKKIMQGIELNQNLTVVLNADDPSLYDITEKLKYTGTKFIKFGFESVKYFDYEKDSKSPSENLYCPTCHAHILYKERYYAQLGNWYCKCGTSRKTPEISADASIYKNKSVLNVRYKGNTYTFTTTLTGLYNAYNALGAIALALIFGIDSNVIEGALSNYSPVFGRHQQTKLKNGGTLTIHLIKNPVGASEVLRGLTNLQNTRIAISINDNYADGRDVSWLWDADFEKLSDFKNVIYTMGNRSYDMALRLKHAGFEKKLIEVINPKTSVKNGICRAIEELNKDENLTALVTYTSLLEINKNISYITKKYGE